MQRKLNTILAKVQSERKNSLRRRNSDEPVKQKYHNLYLIGDIDEAMNEKVITQLIEADLDENSEVNLFISSAGGCLHDCFAMIDLIEYQKSTIGYTVNTFALGEVCSGGFFMFIIGDNRVLFPKCRVYVHEHIVDGEDGQPYEKKMNALKEERILNKIYVQFVADSLGVEFKNAKKLLEKDKWLTDKEIEEFNITTMEQEDE